MVLETATQSSLNSLLALSGIDNFAMCFKKTAKHLNIVKLIYSLNTNAQSYHQAGKGRTKVFIHREQGKNYFNAKRLFSFFAFLLMPSIKVYFTFGLFEC